MSYGLKQTAKEFEVTVSAESRDQLFMDALRGSLEAAYGVCPEGDGPGERVFPVQASGTDTGQLLVNLLRECQGAVAAAGGTIAPPRWLAFDQHRATANLRLLSSRTDFRTLRVGPVRTEENGGTISATIVLQPAV